MDLSDYLREGGGPDTRKLPQFPPGKLGAVLKQGVSEYQSKRYDRAVSSFTAALQMNPDSMILARIYDARAESYIGTKEFKKAVADANEALRLDRRSSVAYNARGKAYANMGDMARALNDFESAIRLDRNFAEARRNREIVLRLRDKKG
jgi:tetratricopeptide (TPR) repeat protein